MRAWMVVVLVGAVAMVAVGCGPKEEVVPWDPAMATAVAAPAEGAPAVTETPLPPVEPAPAPAPKVETAPPVHKAKAKTSAGETVSKPKAHGSHTYTVKAGDTLSGIAKRVYGDANQWKKIADANKDKIHNKNRIAVGMVLAIPPK